MLMWHWKMESYKKLLRDIKIQSPIQHHQLGKLFCTSKFQQEKSWQFLKLSDGILVMVIFLKDFGKLIGEGHRLSCGLQFMETSWISLLFSFMHSWTQFIQLQNSQASIESGACLHRICGTEKVQHSITEKHINRHHWICNHVSI